MTKLKPTKKEIAEIQFAFNVCKYVKSNAIVLCNNFSTIGIGAGQPSRLDSCKIAVQKAKQFQSSKIRNSVAASDAFFPLADGINTLIIDFNLIFKFKRNFKNDSFWSLEINASAEALSIYFHGKCSLIIL